MQFTHVVLIRYYLIMIFSFLSVYGGARKGPHQEIGSVVLTLLLQLLQD